MRTRYVSLLMDLLRVKITRFVFAGSNSIFHFVAHLSKAMISPCRLEKVILDPTKKDLDMRETSSANKNTSEDTSAATSEKNKMNSKGERTVPCGTPASWKQLFEYSPITLD
mmetsp:Transcript_1435/g.2631  ORF Transcript_1435/g.2631 Transcript_1435/m.2631 type:complete len:112 (-) Transcript_1435:1231-1566(-)